MTTAEKIAETEELRGLAVAALKSAYNAQAYSIGNRSKQMADVKALKQQIAEYDLQLRKLNNSGIQVKYGVPEC